jgi:hypothetical protein
VLVETCLALLNLSKINNRFVKNDLAYQKSWRHDIRHNDIWWNSETVRRSIRRRMLTLNVVFLNVDFLKCR